MYLKRLSTDLWKKLRKAGESATKKQLALLATVFKLLGNTAYGKLIEALERQMTEKYTSSESVLGKKRTEFGVV